MQHVASALAIALGDGERRGGDDRSDVRDVAQIAVVGRRGIAHHGIDASSLGGR
jgi:hypothetical protein